MQRDRLGKLTGLLVVLLAGCSASAPTRPMPPPLDPVSTSSPVSAHQPPQNPLAAEIPDATSSNPAGSAPGQAAAGEPR